MKFLQFRQFIVMIAALTIIYGCSSNDESAVGPSTTDQSNQYLVSKDTFISLASGDISGALSFSEALTPLTEQIKYRSTIYKIVYNTKYKGEDIQASGLVVIPDTEDEIDMLSFHHGTIGSDPEAPSNISLSPQNQSLVYFYGAIASVGMVAVIPDFIGFGASSNVPHPYYVADLTASSIVDCIKAAKELAVELNANFSGDLYLAGYSQGGQATMVTHKYIENEGLDGFNFVASFPSSGGYDIKGFQEYFFTLDTYHQPFFMGYVVNGFVSAYDLEIEMSEIFNAPYADRIAGLYDGTYTGTEINEQLNDTLSVLLTQDVLTGIDSLEKFRHFRDLLVANSPASDGWVPQTRMFMYHGDADITVPYQNSVDVYNQLLENGASSDLVTFKPLPDATHGSGVTPYIVELVNEVNTLRMN